VIHSGALSPFDHEARERVSAACTPYRYGVLGDRRLTTAKDHFEIDLVLTSHRRVYAGECKHRPAIPTNEVPKKLHALVRSAVLLRADEIILASVNPEPGIASSFASSLIGSQPPHGFPVNSLESVF
jgi:hypothetical protein